MIRTATLSDVDIITELEQLCFPAAEAADRERFLDRLTYFSNHFYLYFEQGKLVAVIDGFCTDEKDLDDLMYEKSEMHNEEGKWQMIFGVLTHPDYRLKHYATTLMEYVIQQAKEDGREGLVLTCKDALIPFYSRFGYQDEGMSSSQHGNVSWHQMRLLIKS